MKTRNFFFIRGAYIRRIHVIHNFTSDFQKNLQFLGERKSFGGERKIVFNFPKQKNDKEKFIT